MGTSEQIDRAALRIEVVCVLHTFRKKPFSLIDKILGLEPGESRKTYERNQEEWESWTKKFAADAFASYLRNQMTVLELVSQGTPKAIQMWVDMLNDPDAGQGDKEKAAKALLEWTKVFLSSRDSGKIREMIPPHLRDAFDEAEKESSYLEAMIGSTLGPEYTGEDAA